MKRLRSAQLILLAFIGNGCVIEYENGLVEEDGNSFFHEPALFGDWIDEEKETEEEFRIERKSKEDKYYIMTGINAEGKREDYATLTPTKIGGTLFLDVIFRQDTSEANDNERHYVLKVLQLTPRLQLAELKESYIKNHPKEIAHRIEENKVKFKIGSSSGEMTLDDVIVTASTKELRKFIEECADNEAAWEKTYDFLRNDQRVK